MSYRVYIRSRAFGRKDVSKTLRALAPTLERHLIKLYFSEDKHKNHSIREIDSYANDEFDFLIKKNTSISKDGIYAMLLEESELEGRIIPYLKDLEDGGYLLNRNLSVSDAVSKFKIFMSCCLHLCFEGMSPENWNRK